MIEEAYLEALRLIHDKLGDDPYAWAITGSLGMALQGMDLEVHDIDIQTDEDGAYEVERRLSDFVVKPVLYKGSERMRSRMGKLSIKGIQVEVFGGVQKRLEDGTWEPPVDVAAHTVTVNVQGTWIPVLSLEHEYEAYKLMGRDEKAAQIRRWLDSHVKP